ncbi:MAG: hypothetical protein GX774_05885 [Armatimonadetes bacterium]|nr:hypothetical protein [Armatimonadota bacterium]
MHVLTLTRRVLLLMLALPAAAMAGPGTSPRPEGVVAGILLLLVALPSLVMLELLVLALLPGPVAAARRALVQRSGVCFLAGVITLLLGGALLAVLADRGGGGGLLAVLIAAALLLGIVLGLPAIGALVGHTLLELGGRTPSRLTAATWGLAILFGASLFPVLGWALFVFLCLTALGAVTLALLGRRERLDSSSPNAEPEP